MLPSTFVGSRRYLDQLYFDGMAICSSLGFPDLFLTMTCNPNWPEIVRILKPMGLKPHDRPYIISRVFKMKFEALLHDLKKRHVLGKILAYHVWEETRKWLCNGILYNQRNIANNQGLVLSDKELQNLTLLEIEKLLQENRRSLRDYPPVPYPKGYVSSKLGNRLIYDELNYDTIELKDNFNLLFQFLTVASSGIASLPGGRTTHSKFKIHVPSLENSICNIHQGSELAGLLKQKKVNYMG
ncbi:hypothetical protein Lal_00032856 [Lupinus albus]|nr:hypothetical protein Lal_00032856 [Lupinus albus]